MLYKKLQKQQEIRLVRIKPLDVHQSSPNSDTDVCCTLEHSIRGETPYLALSYTWGDQNDRCPIRVGDEVFSIGKNLESALRELRARNQDVVVWVDQLCINQEDEDEKSYQVQQMKEIFADATGVIAWIGPAADDSGLLINTLKRTARDAASNDYYHIVNDHELDLTLYSVPDAFRKFCQRDYWSRLWIMQEFAVGRELQISCGNMTISYDSLLEAIRFVEEFNLTNAEDTDEPYKKELYPLASPYWCPEFSFMQGVVSRRWRYQSLKHQSYFFRILVDSSILAIDYNHPQCTNPRDRIFSLLGLANDEDTFRKIIDYSKKCEDVYEAIARKFLDQGHVDILALCQFPKASSMPTWVPDWRQPTRNPCTSVPWFSSFCASKGSPVRQKLTHPNNGRITLFGTFIDVVSTTGSIWDPDWLADLPTEYTKQYMSEIHTFCKQSLRVSESDLDYIAGLVAIADRNSIFSDTNDAECSQRCAWSFNQLLELLNKSETHLELNLEMADPLSVYARQLRALHSRRPFISKTGFIGLAPMHVIPGDVICIFLRGRTPYVLRRQDDGVYELVGETYVHGVMYGEFMRENPVTETITLR